MDEANADFTWNQVSEQPVIINYTTDFREKYTEMDPFRGNHNSNQVTYTVFNYIHGSI